MRQFLDTPIPPGMKRVGWHCTYHNGICHNPLDCSYTPILRFVSTPEEGEWVPTEPQAREATTPEVHLRAADDPSWTEVMRGDEVVCAFPTPLERMVHDWRVGAAPPIPPKPTADDNEDLMAEALRFIARADTPVRLAEAQRLGIVNDGPDGQPEGIDMTRFILARAMEQGRLQELHDAISELEPF